MKPNKKWPVHCVIRIQSYKSKEEKDEENEGPSKRREEDKEKLWKKV